MYSNMCVKIALCLGLIACIDGHVLKHQEVPLTPEGMTVEITVRNKGDSHPLSTMTIDIDELNKKVVMSMVDSPIKVPNDGIGTPTDVVPTLENRNSIRVGACPLGYTRRGGFCFPDDD